MRRFLRQWYTNALRFWDRLFSWNDSYRTESGKPVFPWLFRSSKPVKRNFHPVIEGLEQRQVMTTVQLTAGTYSVGEADGSLLFTAELDAASATTVTVNYSATASSATDFSDYALTSGTLIFLPNETTKTFSASIANDSLDESNETFVVQLTPVFGATLGTNGSATVTIEDNDPTPSVYLDGYGYFTNEYMTFAHVSVNLSAASGRTVTVNYSTSNGSATAGSDYTSSSGTLTFEPGETVQLINVLITNDTLDEDDETLSISLSSPSNATLGTASTSTLTIYDDDDPPYVQFSASSYSVQEWSGEPGILTVTLSTASGRTVTVDYQSYAVTATAGSDYTSVSSTVTFAPGETSKTIEVPILRDEEEEGDETLTVGLLTSATASTGSPGVATLTILGHHAPQAYDDPDGITAAWWQLAEGSGTKTSDEMIDQTATLPSGVTWASTAASAANDAYSVQFSSASSGINAGLLDLGRRDASFSLWLKWSSLGSAVYLSQEDDSNSWSLRSSSGTSTLLEFEVDSTEVLQYPFSGTTGQWYHVAVTRDEVDDIWALYIDGSLVASSTSTVGLPELDDNASLVLGSSDFSGYLDDVRIYRHALTTATVEDLYDGSYVPVEPYAVTEQTPYTLAATTVLANDADGDADGMLISNWEAPKHGKLSFNGVDFVYTPDADYVGPDRFKYSISDGKLGSGSAYVYFKVAQVNDAPVAKGDAFTTPKNTSADIKVFVNDYDVDGDELSITSWSTPAHGSVTLHNNGTSGFTGDDYLVYTPTTSYSGDDEFTYTISDGNGGTSTATVTLQVYTGQWATSVISAESSWDHTPYDWLAIHALGKPNTFAYGDIVTAWAPLPEDPDPDFPELNYVSVTFGFAIPDYSVGVLVRETYGNGFITQIDLLDEYDVYHDAVWSGNDPSEPGAPVDFVTTWSATAYKVKGVRLTVAVGNVEDEWEEIDAVKLLDLTEESVVTTAPTAAADSATLSEDGSVNISVKANDTNTAGYPLILSISSQPSNGYASIHLNNTPDNYTDDYIVYTPDPDYYGSDSFTYTITDIWGQSSTATVSLTVTNVNDAPTVTEELFFKSTKNTAASLDILSNASDPESNSLTLSITTGPANGSASVSGGSISYTPTSGFMGVDKIAYSVSDGNGGTDSGIAFITVYEDGAWTPSVIATTSEYGTSDYSAADATGAPDTFYYGDASTAWAAEEADDGTHTITLGLSTSTVAQATGVVIRETNGNGFVTKVELRDTSTNWYTVWTGTDPSQPGKPTDFVIRFDQTIYYVDQIRITVDTDHAEGIWEQIDAVNLLTGGSPSGTSTDTYAVNRAPTGGNDWTATNKNTAVVVNVLGNDFDPDGDALTASAVTQGTSGTVTIAGDSLSVTYTPNTNYTGADSFTYTASDGAGGTVTKTVNVYVADGQWANSVIAVSSEAGYFGYDSTATAALGTPDVLEYGDSGNAWSPAESDDGVKTITLGIADADYVSGVLIRETLGNGFVTQIDLLDTGDTWHNDVWSDPDTTPAAEAAHFVASFSTTAYQVKAVRIHIDTDHGDDGYEAIDAVKVLTSSAPPSNTAPDAVADSKTTSEDVPVEIHVLSNDTDANSNDLRITGWTQPAHGSVVIDTRGTPYDPSDDFFLYRPDTDYNGSDSFTYTISDGRGGTDTVTVSLTVNAVNDAPVAQDDHAVTGVSATVTIDVTDNDSDTENDTLSISLSGLPTPLHGTALVSGTNILYTPTTGYTGVDYFTYTLSDGTKTTTGKVFVQVHGSGQWASTLLAMSADGSEGWGMATQALGAPNTVNAGDGATAWAPSATGQYEFLHVSFDTAQQATGILIRQSGGGGYIQRVEFLKTDGSVEYSWVGEDPTTTSGIVDWTLRFPQTTNTVQSVRIFVDCSAGSPQIDAVQLLTGGSFSGNSVSAWAYEADGTATFTEYGADGPATIETYVRGDLYQTEEFTYTSGSVSALIVTDALGRKTRTTYDSEDRVLTSTLAYGTTDLAGPATTTYDYDSDGNLESLTDPVGNVTSWTYSPAGRELTMTDPLSNTETKTYDSEGRLATLLSRNGLLRTFEYDSEGRLQYEKWYSGSTTSTTLVQTFTWTYNSKGQLESASKSDGVDTYTYSYTYNSAGQIIKVVLPFSVTLTFGYDEYGNRNLVKDSLGGEERSVYDDRGLLVTRILKQGGTVLRIDQTYDEYGRILTQRRYSDEAGSTLVAATTFGYDQAGHITSIDHDAVTDVSYDYTWDEAGQLTQWVDHGITHTYDYDDQGQLTQDDDGSATNYAYDKNGNRTAYTHGTVHKNQIIDDGTWTYTYDANGNMTGKDENGGGDSWVYEWDHANQLIEVTEYDGATLLQRVEFTYDVYGNRIQKVINPAGVGPASLYQRYAYDGWNTSKPSPVGNENWDVFADLTDMNALTVRYLRGDVVDQVFGRTNGTDPYWLLTDHLGSVRDVVDDDGDIQKTVTYDAFGSLLSESGSIALGRYAWTSRERDAEIHLQYSRARFYSPGIGRWVSQDPLGFHAGDGNLYRYVHNSPLWHTDPSGLRLQIGFDQVNEKEASAFVEKHLKGWDNKAFALSIAQEIVKTKGRTAWYVNEDDFILDLKVRALLFRAADRLPSLKHQFSMNGKELLHIEGLNSWKNVLDKENRRGAESIGSSFDAIQELFSKEAKGDIRVRYECNGAILLLQHKAIADLLGKDRYDRAFPELQLFGGRSDDKYFRFIANVTIDDTNTVLFPGDMVTFVSIATKHLDWLHENTLYTGLGIKGNAEFFAHMPTGAKVWDKRDLITAIGKQSEKAPLPQNEWYVQFKRLNLPKAAFGTINDGPPMFTMLNFELLRQELKK